MPAERTPSKASETRRSTKPIMEKRRRARINNSLSELKNLILDALKKDNARHSKLEKADILEMTVKHLQNLQRHQAAAAIVSDPSVVSKYTAGFNECAAEVSRFLGRVDNVDTAVRQRLMGHLANCLSSVNNATSSNSSTPSPVYTPPQNPINLTQMQPIHVQVPRPVDLSSKPDTEVRVGDKVFGGLQLVATRLPTGELAFLLPSSAVHSAPSPISVLGSAGILSPAASDRSSSPMMTQLSIQTSHQVKPKFEPISPAPAINEPVWRPW